MSEQLSEQIQTSLQKSDVMKRAVLIDDDELVHMMWKMSAKKHSITLITYSSPTQFLAEQSKITLDTPIYIDSNLGNGIKGEEIAQQLKQLGYREIHLTTGYDAANFGAAPGLTSVIGKAPPWS